MKSIKALLALGLMLAVSIGVSADVPKLINFQGILEDGSGNPVADGTYTLRFRIYDDSTIAEASFLWTETVPVQVTDGLFQLRLGDDTPLPADLFTGSDRFVGVKVNVDPEMARLRLISVPYAFHSLRADSAAIAEVAMDLTCNSCVGTSDIDATQVQRRVSGTAPGGEYITAINQDGTVTTAPDQVGAASGWSDDGVAVRLTNADDSVGIGTSAPQSKLDLVGAARIRPLDGDPDKVLVFDHISSQARIYTDASIGTPTNLILGTYPNGHLNQLCLNQSTGFVGIGTTTPASPLTIYRSGFPSLAFDDAGPILWTFTHDGANININEGGSTRSRFASGGNVYFGITGGGVGIGTTTLSATLHIYQSSFPSLMLDDAGATTWSFTHDGSNINMNEGGATRTRFLSGGSVHFGITGGSVGIGTSSPSARLEVEQSSNIVAAFDRQTNDGVIISLEQAGITEGTISVSGTTVSYNAFTGSHYGWTDEVISKGELVSLTGSNRFYHDNENSEIIYGIAKSSVPNDPACLGSYLALSESTQPFSTDNPHLIMAVGNGQMWVVDEGHNIESGDYLISSATPGHAMRDDETLFPIGHIVARAAESVDWNSVMESVDGKKHKKITVLYGNFVRSNTATLNRTIEELQSQNENLEMRLANLEAALLKSRAEK